MLSRLALRRLAQGSGSTFARRLCTAPPPPPPPPPAGTSRLLQWTRASMVAAQTSAIVYGVYLWVQDSEAAHERQLDSAALDAMDRAGAYYTARAPERIVVELESYRWKLVQDNKNAKGFLKSKRDDFDWAEEWLERRVHLDKEAVAMEVNRVTLKNLWYLAKQAYERHPERLNLINDFFFDAPLNGTFAHRNLRLLEPMDQARASRRGTEYHRPEIYRFIEALYGRAPPQRKDTAANSPAWRPTGGDSGYFRRGPAEEAGELALVRRDSWKRNAAAQNAAPKLNAQKTRRE